MIPQDIQQTAYTTMVRALAKPGADILASLTPAKCHLGHMAMGIAGEAGEILDAIKRHTIYNKDLDRENVIEELGDLEFFQEGVRQILGITREEVLLANTNKLAKRYSAGYSDQAAQLRADKLVPGLNVPEPGAVIPAPVPEKGSVGIAGGAIDPQLPVVPPPGSSGPTIVPSHANPAGAVAPGSLDEA